MFVCVVFSLHFLCVSQSFPFSPFVGRLLPSFSSRPSLSLFFRKRKKFSILVLRPAPRGPPPTSASPLPTTRESRRALSSLPQSPPSPPSCRQFARPQAAYRRFAASIADGRSFRSEPLSP